MTRPSAVERCLKEPGYTPARADLGAIVAALGGLSKEESQQVQRVVERAGWPAAELCFGLLPSAEPKLREELVSLLGRFASSTGDPRLLPALLAALVEGTPRCRRLAASALGKLGNAEAEPALLAALAGAPLDLLRSLCEALGKVGSEAAANALGERAETDAEFVRRRQQALLLIARRTNRGEDSCIELDRALPGSTRLRIACRRGLGNVLADELARFSPSVNDPSSVDIVHIGSLRELLVARSALSFGIALGVAPLSTEGIVAALTSPGTLDALTAWTRGSPRFRIDWLDAGHRRKANWEIAHELGKRTQALQNDPRDASWVLEVRAENQRAELRLVPSLDPDPRFAYRCKDVPAASHPTIAAALARVGGVRADDVVWDPFVGSGLELVERGLLGPYQKLIGSDLDARALAAARDNLESAGVQNFELTSGDARSLSLGDVSLIITNPPMGRRVARDGSLAALLEAFVLRIPRTLRPSGRAVLLSPLAERTLGWAERAGLRCERRGAIDLGGFDAELQILIRRS